MSWIETIAPDQATDRLRALYGRVSGSRGRVDNILRVHALRPHTLAGHMALYKAVLHHGGNRLPRWVLELIGVHVSRLNDCAYCVDHHGAGLGRLLGEREAGALLEALDGYTSGSAVDASRSGSAAAGPIDDRLAAILAYATKLTLRPADVASADVAALRAAGLSDGEVLEVNQVVGYFAYANRTVLGLGVTTAGDVLGLSPSNQHDADDWRHS